MHGSLSFEFSAMVLIRFRFLSSASADSFRHNDTSLFRLFRYFHFAIKNISLDIQFYFMFSWYMLSLAIIDIIDTD